MPMRGELAVPALRRNTRNKAKNDAKGDGPWPVLAFCVIGLLLTFAFAVALGPPEQIPLLMMQYNLD